MTEKLPIKITLKLWEKDGTVKLYHSSKTRRIYAIIRADDFLKTYFKVVYGKARTITGKLETIFNDGYYGTREELLLALAAFTEKSLLDETEPWIREG